MPRDQKGRTNEESSQISCAGLGGVVSGPPVRRYGCPVPSCRPLGEVVGPVFVRVWGRDAVTGRVGEESNVRGTWRSRLEERYIL